jgi:lipopolysaccharide transport system permease protein
MAKVSDKELAMTDLTPVFVKSVAWAFFISSIRAGTHCLIGNANLVTRIYFPKLIFPLAAVLANLFDFAIAACVLVVVLAFMGVTAGLTLLWLPLLILLLVLLTAGLAIFLSAAGLFLRDVKYLVEIFLMFAVFVTPVFYDASTFDEWQSLLLLNPVAPLLEGLSDVVVWRRAPNLAWLSYSAIVSGFIFCGAVAFFRRVEPSFAECI